VSCFDALAGRLRERLGALVTRAASSASFTTYRCGGPFAVLVRVEREAELHAVAATLADAPRVEVLVVGRGSNLLVADAGFAGVALVLGGAFDGITFDRAGPTVAAGGAVALPVLARRAAAAGVGGLEFYVGIPGSVGGAVRMNAGGHGDDTAAVLQSARVFDLGRDDFAELPVTDLGLGYRTSTLGPRAVVTDASFAGAPADPAVCAQRIDEIVRWRREHQPGGQNGGSVFTNPPGDAAGRLIDACGLKGLRVGGAVVSEKHANFFVAEPGARADDVRTLIAEVQRRVETETGVRLEPELRLVGFEA
jgi:UDP-N-acetylmuramate dehydrogenase